MDYQLEDTIYIPFTTRAFATGIPTTLAGSPVVTGHRDANLTQFTTGITLSADFDGIAGLNMITVVATAANGYVAGETYTLYLSAGTVSSVSVVGEVVGHFTLDMSAAAKDLANGTDGLGAIKTDTAAILVDTGTTLDGRIPAALTAGGNMKSDVFGFMGTVLTETAGQIAAAFKQFFDVGTPTGTMKAITNVVTATNLTNERGKYSGGSVWIGPSVNTNTVSYVDGITTNPVSTIAAAKTIADALLLRKFFTVRSGTTQIGAAMTNYLFDGNQWACTTTGGSRDVGLSSFLNANVTAGTFAGTTGSIRWDTCKFSTGVSVGISAMRNCRFLGTLTLLEAGDYSFNDCVSNVAGSAAPVFDFQAAVGTQTVSIRRWSGGLTLNNLAVGDIVSIDVVSGGTITLNGADATVVVRGICNVVNNLTGTPTVTTTSVLNQTVLATPTNITAGTITTATNLTTNNDKAGYSLTAATGLGNQTADITGNLSGSVGSVTGAVGSVTGLTASNLDATVSSRMATTHIAATAGVVDRVTLVDTTTTNTDMRGTDGANTTAPDNAGITAVKAKTDSLTFTKAGEVDSNLQSVNGVTVNGDGAGTPMGV